MAVEEPLSEKPVEASADGGDERSPIPIMGLGEGYSTLTRAAYDLNS
jgi:hypothetical protein